MSCTEWLREGRIIACESDEEGDCYHCGKTMVCECRRPSLVVDDTYCFNCHRPTEKTLK